MLWQYTKRDAVKNFFPLPNEIFSLGLSSGALAVYSYLLYCEDRKTYQCYPSCRSIGKAVHMSVNTVRKYIAELEGRGLIITEPTSIITRDGRKHNGTLRYTILPIQNAVDLYNQRQLWRLEETVEQMRVSKKLEGKGIIHIRRQVLRQNGKVVEAPLKTKNSYRNIAIGADAIKVLKGMEQKDEYVFPSPFGGPMSPDSVLHMLQRVLKRAGLERIRFHDLRHTFSVLALQNGVDVKTLSAMLGHYSAGFTLDTYAHVTTSMQKQAANAVGSFLSGTLQP